MNTALGRILYDSCPLCEAKDIANAALGDCAKHPLYNAVISPAMQWKQCNACQHIFTEGYFTDASAAAIFSKTNEHQKVGHDLERNRIISSKMIEKVLPYASSGKWLDIGFGNGALLVTAQEYGFTPVGIDLRADNVAALKQIGIEGHCIDLLKFDRPKQFKVISMADVLEHVPYPPAFLKAVHGLLEEGGVVFLSMPSAGALLWQLMTLANANPYWGELEHFHNFSRERLYALLEEHGFEPLRYGISERYRICMEIVARKR